MIEPDKPTMADLALTEALALYNKTPNPPAAFDYVMAVRAYVDSLPLRPFSNHSGTRSNPTGFKALVIKWPLLKGKPEVKPSVLSTYYLRAEIDNTSDSRHSTRKIGVSFKNMPMPNLIDEEKHHSAFRQSLAQLLSSRDVHVQPGNEKFTWEPHRSITFHFDDPNSQKSYRDSVAGSQIIAVLLKGSADKCSALRAQIAARHARDVAPRQSMVTKAFHVSRKVVARRILPKVKTTFQPSLEAASQYALALAEKTKPIVKGFGASRKVVFRGSVKAQVALRSGIQKASSAFFGLIS